MPHAHGAPALVAPLSESGAGGLAPVLALALLAMVSLWAGSAVPTWASLRSRGFEKHLGLLIGFSAGLMLATSLHDLLPEALEKNAPHAMTGVAIGFLTLYIVERATHFHACRHRRCLAQSQAEACAQDDFVGEPGIHAHGVQAQDVRAQGVHLHGAHSHESHAHGSHAHFHGYYGSGAVRTPADTMALAGMSVHNFADGLTTAVAFGVSAGAGVAVALAIVLHQMAAGLSLGSIMLRAGRNRKRVLLSTLGAASAIPLGVLFYHFVVPVDTATQGLVLGIAGGSFLYVAACDLLPEAHSEDEGWAITAATVGGYIFTLLVRSLGSHAH